MRDERPTIESLSRDIQELKSMIALLLNEKHQPESSDMIGLDEVAKICGFTTKTVYSYLSTGRLNVPITKVGKKVTFKKSDILTWISDRSRVVVDF
jgi:predicted DNA-binding transcriptional regulator AlpA